MNKYLNKHFKYFLNKLLNKLLNKYFKWPLNNFFKWHLKDTLKKCPVINILTLFFYKCELRQFINTPHYIKPLWFI